MQRLLVPALWEVATTAAASFTGAWLYRINTPLPTIVVYYLIWFGVMAAVFGAGASLRRALAVDTVQSMGLGVATLYLILFATLGTDSRAWVWALAVLIGAASGLYWLALYVQAALTIQTGDAAAYTSWLGMLETGAAVIVPPLTGWIVASFPGILGYRLVFCGAAALVVGALFVSRKHPSSSAVVRPRQQSDHVSGWRPVLWTMALLGLRDGVLFFLPGLYLFFRTGNSVWLGAYLSTQAAVQTAAFWLFGRWPWHPAWTLVAALLGGLAIGTFPPVLGVFALGLSSGATYPAFKVPLESHALEAIQKLPASDQFRRTSQKEWALNTGRMGGYVIVWDLVQTVTHPMPALRTLLALWPALAIVLTMAVITVNRTARARTKGP